MPDNKKHNGELSWDQKLARVGAAGAVVASAALAHKKGAYSKFARKLNRASVAVQKMRASGTLSKEITERNMEDYKRIYSAFKKSWKESAEYKTNIIRARPGREKGVLGLVQKVSRIKESAKAGEMSSINKQIASEVRFNPTHEYLVNKYKTKDLNETRRYRNFIHDLSSKTDIEDQAVIRRLKRKHSITGEAGNAIADDLVAHMQKNDRNVDKKQLVNKFAKQMESVEAKALDIDFLERNFGTTESTHHQFTGSRGMSVQEYIDHVHEMVKSDNIKKTEKSDLLKNVNDLLEAHRKIRDKHGEEAGNRFMNLAIDAERLRVNEKGEAYSADGVRSMVDGIARIAGGTTGGQILKLRDIFLGTKEVTFDVVAEGSYNPVLAKAAGSPSGYVGENLFRIGNEFYRHKEDGLEHIKELDNMVAKHGQFGSLMKVVREMDGATRYDRKTGIQGLLDLNQDKENQRDNILDAMFAHINAKENGSLGGVWDKIKDASTFKGDAMQRGLKKAFYNEDLTTEEFDEAVDAVAFLTKSLQNSAVSLDRNIVNSIADSSAFDQKTKDIAGVLQHENIDDMLHALISLSNEGAFDAKKVKNTKLKTVLDSIGADPEGAYERLYKSASRGDAGYTSSVLDTITINPDNEVRTNVEEVLRKELSVEMLASALESDTNRTNVRKEVMSIIENANISTKEKANARRTLDYADISGTLDVLDKKLETADYFDQLNTLSKTYELFSSKKQRSEYADTALERADIFVRENSSIVDKKYEFSGLYVDNTPLDETIYVKKSFHSLNEIESLNSFTKIKEAAKSVSNELFASRDNMGGFSALTAIPYFMTSRLNEAGRHIGIGLSAESMQSTQDMWKAIFLKRAVPAALALNYYEWFDDTTQDITGMGTTAAVASGLAQTDIAIRKGMDAIGLTDALKEQYSINPIMQYWGDGGEFMDSDELKDYYENGYTPIRKGAWWTFGSVNEARGGQIQYWAPTFARRIASDYKDKSLYDSHFDKWSHSWLPTPTNPIAPLVNLANPYWLEQEHADDRPYPISGQLFEENTPWGAIGNATIGRIIKPQKELHNHRLHDGIDIMANLHALNEGIKNAAENIFSMHEFTIRGRNITPVDRFSFTVPGSSGGIIDTINTHTPFSTPSTSDIDDQTKDIDIDNPILRPMGLTAAGIKQGLGVHNNTVGSAGITNNAITFAAGYNGENDDFYYTPLNEKNAAAALYQYGPDSRTAILKDAKGNAGLFTTIKRENKEKYEISFTDQLMLTHLTSKVDFGLKDLSIILKRLDPKNLMTETKDLNDINMQLDLKKNGINEREENIFLPDKLKNYRPTQAMELMSDPDTVAELMSQDKGANLAEHLSKSARLVGGIYGYMGGELFGFGTDNEPRLATGQDMTSLSRGFWDMNFGGAGGGAMEITRRFIPDFKRGSRRNPLMNEMPDWLPDRFKFGDPFAALPRGEARLPGKGYESLNELHPDSFGDYGAFDRYKILADIAPFSPEYKLWKEIAEKTVTDEKLIEEMSEIRERTRRATRKHEFYEYKAWGKDLNYENIVVSEVLGGGKFKSGDKVYKLAGVRVKANANESQEDVLARYIHVGDEVTIGVDNNVDTSKEGLTINAAVMVNGENVGTAMMENGDAEKRKGDKSAAAYIPEYGGLQMAIATASDLIAHADLPFIHDQFLRVRTPLESYKAEITYGTPYQTWSHPIDTYILPAFRRAIHERDWTDSLATLAYNRVMQMEGLSNWNKRLANSAYLLSNRGAFIGGALSLITFKPSMEAAKVSSMAVEALHVFNGGNSYLDQAITAADLGQSVAHFLGKERIGGAIIGAGLGAVYKFATAQDGGEWIPSETKRKWEMEDYFDRLTHIKYEGLYKEAARRALDEEGFDVEDYLSRKEEKEDLEHEYLKEFKDLKKDLKKDIDDIGIRSQFVKLLTHKINILQEEKDDEVVRGGKWTHAALIYKQVANSTIDALNERSTWSEIMTALPANDKEYFSEFVQEKDPKKREEILSMVSPALQRALCIAWGMKPPEREDNEEFFKRHALPGKNWEGWRNDVNLDDIEVRTIENEGMNLADFGKFESQLRDPDVIMSRPLDYDRKQRASEVRRNLRAALNGKGLSKLDIDVEPGPPGGITRIITNIGQYTFGRSKDSNRDRLERRLNQSI